MKNRLVSSAYPSAAFFLSVGPMIGVVIFLIFVQISKGNALEYIFTFVLLGYLFGGVPAVVSGIVFGLANEALVQKEGKSSRYIIILITSISGAALMSLLLWLFGIFNVLLPLLAFSSAVLCSTLRFRDIEKSVNS